MKRITQISCALLACTLQYASATEVVPTHYTVDRLPDSMSYSYLDETGKQLIDGKYGGAFVGLDLGNGSAHEWVGWNINDPVVNIDFTFDGVYHFNQINVSSIQQGKDLHNIVLPSFSLSSSPDGSPGSWTVIDSLYIPENIANNGHQTLELRDLNFESQYLRVSLTHSLDGPWSFSDEVDFFGSRRSVPDAGSSALLFALAAVGIAAFRRNAA